jgi:HK97 family phage major capsid protein
MQTLENAPLHSLQKLATDLRDIKSGISLYMEKIAGDHRALLGRFKNAAMSQADQARSDLLSQKFLESEAELTKVNAELQEVEHELVMRTPEKRIVPPMPIAFNSHTSLPPRSHSASDTVAGPRFSNMFPGSDRSNSREFSNLGEFATAVYQRDPKLFNAASGMGSAVGGDGGFYVPTGFFAGLMDDSLQAEAVRPNATIIPMSSGTMSIPMFNLSNRSTGIATLEGKVTAEGSTAATQKAALREVTMNARKVSVLVPTTTELLQDAPALFGQMLKDAMTEALGQTLDTWFISGTGAGVPLGILNAPCLVSVAKDASQVAATLTPTNISGMVSRLAPGSWSRAQWIVSPSGLAQLFTLATVTKNVAGTENVSGHAPEFFQVLPDGKFSLLGRPVIVSDRCSALGTKGDILLVDLKSYLVGIRQQAELLVDTSIGFKESEIWFRLNCRVDGQPSLAAAITPRVGSATLSPFVSLDTRS